MFTCCIQKLGCMPVSLLCCPEGFVDSRVGWCDGFRHATLPKQAMLVQRIWFS